MASTLDILYACIALFFACALSSAGGIGGGGLNVPIFLIICNFNFTVSSSLSLFVVLGNSLAQFLLNYKQPHPKDPTQPMIFWTFVCLFLPAQLGGGNIGAAVKRMLSDETLYIMALLVLTLAATISLRKGIVKWQAESKEFMTRGSQSSNNKPTQSNTDNYTSKNPMSALETDHVAAMEAHVQPSDQFVRMEVENDVPVEPRESIAQSIISTAFPEHLRCVWPWHVIVVLMIMWLVQLVLRMIATVTRRCKPAFWVSFFMIYCPLTICVVWTLSYVHLQAHCRHHEHPFRQQPNTWNGNVEKVRLVGEYIPQWLTSCFVESSAILQEQLPTADYEPDASNINNVDLQRHGVYLTFVVFGIGVVSNLLGIGGAELVSPLLLVLHVLPEVSSATSGAMNLLNTTANVIVNLLTVHRQQVTHNDDHEAKRDQTPALCIILILVGFAGGLIGRFSGLYVAKKLKRASVIIFALVLGLYLTCFYYLFALADGGVGNSTKSFCEA